MIDVVFLPVTPLHYPMAYLIHKSPIRLSLPGLIVGSMFPDLEVPVMAMFFQNMYAYNRLVLHSLLGALTLGTALSFFFTFLFYPALVKILFRGKKESVRVETAFSVNLLVSCLLGNLSHVLLDVFTHRSNPILWPFQTTTPSPIFTNQISIFIHIFCAALFLVILVNNRGNSVKTLLLDNANLSTTQ